MSAPTNGGSFAFSLTVPIEVPPESMVRWRELGDAVRRLREAEWAAYFAARDPDLVAHARRRDERTRGSAGE